jgi:YceI-like domain
MKVLTVILLDLVFSIAAVAADGPCVIPGRGHFYIHTGTSGLFGAFAHEHLIEAQKVEGCAVIDSNDLTHSSIKLSFATADIRVLDPKESATDRAKVQSTMDLLRLHGNLTIRGKSQPIIVPVTLTRLDDGTFRARGDYKFKQTTFGIRPVQLAGGTIKVKDEVQTEFELFLK